MKIIQSKQNHQPTEDMLEAQFPINWWISAEFIW